MPEEGITIKFDSPRQLYEMAILCFNGLTEIPDGDTTEMDRCAMEWLEQRLPIAEDQLKKTDGMTFEYVEGFITTIQVISALFFDIKTANGEKFLSEFMLHIHVNKT